MRSVLDARGVSPNPNPNPSPSQVAELINSNPNPSQVAELINTYESDGAKEAVKALKRRLGHEPRVLALTLTLLESLMKNCSASFHVEVRTHLHHVRRRVCVHEGDGHTGTAHCGRSACTHTRRRT